VCCRWVRLQDLHVLEGLLEVLFEPDHPFFCSHVVSISNMGHCEQYRFSASLDANSTLAHIFAGSLSRDREPDLSPLSNNPSHPQTGKV